MRAIFTVNCRLPDTPAPMASRTFLVRGAASHADLFRPRSCVGRWLTILGACLLGEPLTGQENQLTTVWLRDLDRDGVSEVSRVEGTWIEYIGGGWPGTMVPITVRGAYLQAAAGAALWSPATPLTTNDVLSPNATQGGYWLEQITLSRQLMPTGEPMPPFEPVGPYVGVRFIAPDGQHVAWVNLQDPDDCGWQPEPGAAIRVGDRPAPPPAPENESSRLTQIDLNGGGLDFVLRTRWRTNVATGVTRTMVTLTNRAGFEVLVTPAEVATGTVWFPLSLTEGFFPPSLPAPPAVWRGAPATVLLFDEERDEEGNVLARAGPLAARLEVVVTVRDQTLSPACTGWIRISRNFEVLAHDLSGGTVGEPARQAYEDRRTRWDVNGDGQVDFVTVVNRQGQFDYLGIWNGTAWTELVPLRHTRLLSGDYLTATAAITVVPVDGRSWSNIGMTLDRTPSPGDPDPSHYLSRSEGYLGLRLDIASGIHLAWFRPSDDSFAFEPRPATALFAGAVPESLWAFTNVGLLAVSWNAALTNQVIESTVRLDPPDWQAIGVGGQKPGRAVLPLEGDRRFFRLAPGHR